MTKEPKVYAIPEGTRVDKCRSCGAPIQWVLTGNFKKDGTPAKVPVNSQGHSHFTDCPHAEKWTGKKR
jgi:hypothetical protein